MQLSWQGALCEPSTVGVDTRVHLTNLVIAARNVLRIGAIARDVDGVAAALQSFDDKVQNVTRVRDILEHFDDYHLGRGKLQRQRHYGDFDLGVRDNGKDRSLCLGGGLEISAHALFNAALALTVQLQELLQPGRMITAQPR